MGLVWPPQFRGCIQEVLPHHSFHRLSRCHKSFSVKAQLLLVGGGLLKATVEKADPLFW